MLQKTRLKQKAMQQKVAKYCGEKPIGRQNRKKA